MPVIHHSEWHLPTFIIMTNHTGLKSRAAACCAPSPSRGALTCTVVLYSTVYIAPYPTVNSEHAHRGPFCILHPAPCTLHPAPDESATSLGAGHSCTPNVNLAPRAVAPRAPHPPSYSTALVTTPLRTRHVHYISLLLCGDNCQTTHSILLTDWWGCRPHPSQRLNDSGPVGLGVVRWPVQPLLQRCTASA